LPPGKSLRRFPHSARRISFLFSALNINPRF
jgi:hypothetical protein